MKNIITLLTIMLTIGTHAITQNNNYITYQGVASNSEGELVRDREIGLMFEVSESGEIVYAETHKVRTSSTGVFSVLMGAGDVLEGSYASIDWSRRNQMLSSYVDIEGNDDFYFLGQTAFSSVPYARYGEDADADPENELQHLYYKPVGPDIIDLFLTQSEDSVRIYTGAPATDRLNNAFRPVPHANQGWMDFWLVSDNTNVVSVDADPFNELQNLTAMPGLNGQGIKLKLNVQNGNLPQEVTIDDHRLQHRIRTDVVTQSEVTELKLINANGVMVDSFIIFDTDHLNEIQDLIFSLEEGPNGTRGNLALSKNPGTPSVILPDLDPTNELQDLYYDDGVLYIEGGNEVELPIGEGGSSPWEYINNMNIEWPHRISIGEVVSDGPGWFSNLTSLNNVFSQTFRTPNGVLEMTDEFIKLGSDFMVNSEGYMFVKEIAAEIKNFRMDHPEDPSKEIYYVSLEGPEAGAYERGTARLINGEAFVPYSDHFQLVIGDNVPTMILTPQSIETYGLAVVEKRADGFVVRELMNGKGNFAFDWEVKAVRAGYEDYRVVRDKK